tara:strand:+ start:12749 stop:13576 length:828 start_codon:yes stop_codon:yes gene_type:complete
MSKNCTVISTFFGKRRTYPKNTEETINYLNKYIPYLQKLDSGLSSDIILVNHCCEKSSDPESESLKFISKFNNSKTKNGIIKVINRPWENGVGGSFKSFDYAFKKFKNEYDYWFFVEDDVKINIPNYFLYGKTNLKELIKENVAYLCVGKHGSLYFGGCHVSGINDRIISIKGDENCEERMSKDFQVGLHCHGGAGFTHKKFLNMIVEKYGHLPYCKEPASQDGSKINYICFEREGEVKFSNVYLKEGYKIAFFNAEKFSNGKQICPKISGVGEF